MAQISRKDLICLTSEQIKSFYTIEDIRNFNVSPIKEYIDGGRENYSMSMRINRVSRILHEIIVERFINNTL